MNLENDLKTIVKYIIEKLNYGYRESIYQLSLCYELVSAGANAI